MQSDERWIPIRSSSVRCFKRDQRIVAAIRRGHNGSVRAEIHAELHAPSLTASSQLSLVFPIWFRLRMTDLRIPSMTEKKNWIDATMPINAGLVHWPGDPDLTFTRAQAIERGDVVNVTLCRMSVHSGTHMDAPAHFLPGGAGMESFPPEVGVGRARVIVLPQDCNLVTSAHLEGQGIGPGDRVLLKTRNSNVRWHNQEFKTDYVGIDATAAQFLVDAGVQLIGIDYLSIGTFDGDGIETHRILLAAGVWIVEGLDLAGAQAGMYDIICLPLPIEGSDGSPARVLLRPL